MIISPSDTTYPRIRRPSIALGVTLALGFLILNRAGAETAGGPAPCFAQASYEAKMLPEAPDDAVRWVQPAGRVFIPEGTSAVLLPVAVEITLPDDLAPLSTVSFVLDGTLFAATQLFGLFTTAVWLAPGIHEIQVQIEVPLPPGDEPDSTAPAGAEQTDWTWTSEPLTFQMLSAADADENGLPDAGPGILTAPGDLWLAADTPDGRPRWTALTALRDDDADTGILLPLPGAVSGLAWLQVPAALTAADEVRMAGLALARDETALAVAYPEIEAERPGAPVPPGVYARLSLFAQQGSVWREIGASLPGSAPLRLSLAGLRPSSGYAVFPALRPLTYYLESETGQLIPALTEERWQREPAIMAETPINQVAPTTLMVNSTGLAGVFQQGIPANLSVEPGGASGYLHLGILPAGKTWTQEFTLSNSGSSPITGQCQLTGHPAFRLIEPAAYTVLPGQTTTVMMTFLPNAEGTYAADLTFSGGAQGPLTIQIEAYAADIPAKARRLFTCSARQTAEPATRLSAADAAAVLVVLLLLSARRLLSGRRP